MRLFISMSRRSAIVSPASERVHPTMTESWLGAPKQRTATVVCASVHVHACVRDVFAIYDDNILSRLIMMIIKIMILYSYKSDTLMISPQRVYQLVSLNYAQSSVIIVLIISQQLGIKLTFSSASFPTFMWVNWLV